MKICPNCNTNNSDDSMFCVNCGSSVSAVAPVAEQPNYNNGYANQVSPYIDTQVLTDETPIMSNQPPQMPQQPPQMYQQMPPQMPQQPSPMYQQPSQMYQQMPPQMPPQPPKKSKKGLIIALIIVAVLVLGGIVAGVAVFFLKPDVAPPVTDEDSFVETEDEEDVTEEAVIADDEEPDDTVEPDVDVAYNTGTFDGNTYINDWAGLQVTLPEGWTNGTEDEYSMYETDGKTDCWLAIMNAATQEQIIILAEPLYGISTTYTAKQYLEIVLTQATAAYDDMNVTYEVSDYYTESLAGKDFDAVDISLYSGMTSTQYKSVKIDNYVISILLLSVGEEIPASDYISKY